MDKILVVYKYNQVKQSIIKELEREGYDIRSIEADSLDFPTMDPSDFNLAVITPCADVASTWSIFLDFKDHFHNLPVVAYMGQHGAEHLKSAIKKVLSK